jgi:hypothetical protein
MKDLHDILDQVEKIKFEELVKYIGCPICIVTPEYIRCTNSRGREVITPLFSGYNEKWTIFDGTIIISNETKDATYWTFKCLKN